MTAELTDNEPTHTGRPCPYCRGSGISSYHMVRRPKHIKEWLAINPDVPAFMLVCDVHGKWFEHIDPLAPYHWETSRCEDCR